ncbi:complement C1q domain-containing protein [Chryseobacterium arthrosphaerae]|uniref:complement C1q domain-containing protein n=1 Tax=Chryseobacterium arthrosphaerae TaxID=651561 RepID=UPI001F4B873C|nr:complement C1q domain-containing protein [Chryseobacterium arthrosphaerae]MDG4651453.1 complement C1q domain-containing protein [Chryseobacterium arthrosphaerae]
MKSILITLSLLCGLGNLHAQMGNVGIGTTSPGSKITVNGSFAAAYGNITANTYNISENDFYVSWAGTADGTVTLPDSTTGLDRKGRTYYVKNTSQMYILTIDANGTELIDNAQNVPLLPGESALLVKTDDNTAGGTTYQLVLLSKADTSYICAVSSSTSETHNQGTTYKANFTSVDFSTNGGADFNLATDTWTCPKSGYYKIEFMETGYHTSTNVAAHRLMSILKNGVAQSQQYYTMVLLGVSASQRAGAYDSVVLNLKQGDTITGSLVMCNGCGTASMTSFLRRMVITKI